MLGVSDSHTGTQTEWKLHSRGHQEKYKSPPPTVPCKTRGIMGYMKDRV